MGKITFVVGGARSGKSTYALTAAKKSKRKVAFIATCQPLDKEMECRIALHKKSRPLHWHTFEEAKDVDAVVKDICNKFGCVVIDCLTLMVSNLILSGCGRKVIEDKITRLIGCLKKSKGRAIIVSNEVGLGIVPVNKLARDFRDIAGSVNQIMAKESDEVIFMVSGLPWRIK
jgi:adenosylcobinamide kinase/adenosylcobinamide-phosphate guanylyltransferase